MKGFHVLEQRSQRHDVLVNSGFLLTRTKMKDYAIMRWGKNAKYLSNYDKDVPG